MSKWFSVQAPRNQPSRLNCLRRRFMHDAPVAANKSTFLAPFNDVGGSGDNPGKNRGKSQVKDGWSKPSHLHHIKFHST